MLTLDLFNQHFLVGRDCTAVRFSMNPVDCIALDGVPQRVTMHPRPAAHPTLSQPGDEQKGISLGTTGALCSLQLELHHHRMNSPPHLHTEWDKEEAGQSPAILQAL